MADFKGVTAAELLKGVAAIVVGVIATMAWFDGRFLTTADAKDFVKATRVEGIERLVKFQEFNYIIDKIEKEESAPPEKRKPAKIKSLYMQKHELKKELGL